MRKLVALAVVAVALLGAGSAVAANYAQESLDRDFRIEYQGPNVAPGCSAGTSTTCTAA